MDEYLIQTGLPKLSEEEREDLEKQISLEEIQQTIRNMKIGKAPGPDGLTPQYFHVLSPILGPYMERLFNERGPEGMFARDTLADYLTLILKEGKDPANCGSYRPISLLNTDLKIFTKILATRMSRILSRVIHLDQVGFMMAREATCPRTLPHSHIPHQFPCSFDPGPPALPFPSSGYPFSERPNMHIIYV